MQEIRRDPLFGLLGDQTPPVVPAEYGDLRDALLRALRSHRLTLDQICTRIGRPPAMLRRPLLSFASTGQSASARASTAWPPTGARHGAGPYCPGMPKLDAGL